MIHLHIVCDKYLSTHYVSDIGDTTVNKSNTVSLISIHRRQVKNKAQRNKKHLVCFRNHQRASMVKDEVGEGPYQVVPLM